MIFHVQPYQFKGNIAQDDKIALAFTALKKQLPLSAEEDEIIKNIGNLLNSVYEVQAIAELRKRQENVELMQNPKVFEHVCLLMSVYRFRPKGRKFVWNLFEGLIFGNLVDKQSFY